MKHFNNYWTMKWTLLLWIVCLHTSSFSQYIGELEGISIPAASNAEYNNLRYDNSLCDGNAECQDGYMWGYEKGESDGYADADFFCSWGWTREPVIVDGTTIPWRNGYSFGWNDGYIDGYIKGIEAKEKEICYGEQKLDGSTCVCKCDHITCPSGYYMNDFFGCECVCDEVPHVYDGDGDGYYNVRVFVEYYCVIENPDPTHWIPITASLGPDCDDGDRSKHSYNDCGVCSSNPNTKTPWYYDEDGDNYHSEIRFSCFKPTDKNPVYWKLTTRGPDCSPTVADENIPKKWYYFGDEDQHYGVWDRTPCNRPTWRIPSRWVPEEKFNGLSRDCDDTDSDIHGVEEYPWHYDFDGDGYKLMTVKSCERPDDDHPDLRLRPEVFDHSKWVRNIANPNGPKDCDDEDPKVFKRNSCNQCDIERDKVTYIDIDGDGYHSFEMNLCHNPTTQFTKEYLQSSTAIPSDFFNSSNDILDRGSNFGAFGYHSQVIDLQEGKAKVLIAGESGLWTSPAILFYTHFYVGYRGFGKASDIQFYRYIPDGEGMNFDGYEISSRRHNINKRETLGLDTDDLDPNRQICTLYRYDYDGDGYWDESKGVHDGRTTCTRPDEYWLPVDELIAADCDDDDKLEFGSNTWYYFGDEDNYWGSSVSSCENPGTTPDEKIKWSLSPKEGQDCNDDVSYATIVTDWYFDEDDDGYYGRTTSSCLSPDHPNTAGSKWKKDKGQGADCDDSDPNIHNTIEQYLDLDGDEYYSIKKSVECANPYFTRTELQNSSFPSTLIQSPGTNRSNIAIPGTSYTFEVREEDGESRYFFPSQVLKTTGLDPDCNDLDASQLADGEWANDEDQDGYYDETTIVSTCSPPEGYILTSQAIGKDCDDTEITANEIQDWYLDRDGDGYYTETVRSCLMPSSQWSTTSNKGPDIDDDDLFTPAVQYANCEVDFVIPSLLRQTKDKDGFDVIAYNGYVYDPDNVKIIVNDREYSVYEIIYDAVGPVKRVDPRALITPRGAPLIGAQLITAPPLPTIEDPSTPTINGSARILGASSATVVGNPKTEGWIAEVIERYSTYTNVPVSLTLDSDHENDYYQEFFDPAELNKLIKHYQDFGDLPFSFKIESFEETGESILNPEKNKYEPKEFSKISETTIGTGPEAFIITAKRWKGHKEGQFHVAVVISINDDVFKATDQELGPDGIGWKVNNGGNLEWKNPEDQAIYFQQLGELSEYRKLFLSGLAIDFDDGVSTGAPTPEVPELAHPKEPEVTYNFGKWGLLTKWVEYMEVGHHLSHHFEMPSGTWDNPEGSGTEEEVKAWNKWRLKSPSSVAGTVDESIVSVKDMAETIKLAQSLCYKDTWLQILESVRQFDAGDQMSTLIESWKEEYDKITGDFGAYKQYYSIGRVGVRAVRTIYASWASIGKLPSKLCGIKGPSPVNALTDDRADFTDFFKEKNVPDGKKSINRTSQYGDLTISDQEKLINDIATSKDDLLAKALSENPELVNAWKTLDETGYTALRKNPASLEKLNGLLKNPKLADSGLDENIISDLIRNNRGLGAAALDDITKGLDDLVASGTKFEDIGRLTGEFAKGGNFAKGARYIQRHITGNADEFSGKRIRFEETFKAGETTRRIDVNVRVSDNSPITFYEFKSTRTIPPENFSKQFINDLKLDDVSDLDQVKWYFDGNEIRSLQKSDFIDALASFKSDLFGSKARNLFEDYLDVPFTSADDMIANLRNNDEWFHLIFHVK